jgi:hypothetical protein
MGRPRALNRTESGIVSETVEQVRFVPLVKGMG